MFFFTYLLSFSIGFLYFPTVIVSFSVLLDGVWLSSNKRITVLTYLLSPTSLEAKPPDLNVAPSLLKFYCHHCMARVCRRQLWTRTFIISTTAIATSTTATAITVVQPTQDFCSPADFNIAFHPCTDSHDISHRTCIYCRKNKPTTAWFGYISCAC